MDTVRVNICYRPLRICWAIGAGDRSAFRDAVKFSHTMWGGRFNPIAIVDRPEEAERIVDVFRADIIVPVGTGDSLDAFKKRFPHLISPFFPDGLFVGSQEHGFHSHVLDIQNALVELDRSPALESIKKHGLRIYTWDNDDPLADVFLMQWGQYPDPIVTGVDYLAMVKNGTGGTEQAINKDAPIPVDILEHPSLAYLSRHGLHRHYGIQSNWDYEGVYLGDVANLDDLISFWNLRAADTSLIFVDKAYINRYQQLFPAWNKSTKQRLSTRRFEHHRNIAVWARRESMPADATAYGAELKQLLGTDDRLTICGIDMPLWNGLNLKAPMMILGETSQLGVLITDSNQPKLTFTLGDKPFSGHTFFHTQHLVASLSFIGGLHGDDLHTLVPPYIPELNEFFARTMHFRYSHLRIEPARVGLIIDAADSDTFLYALPVADLFERIFKLAGYTAKPSTGGLITRQIVAQLGGLRGAAVFKIPGVRRLLKTFGPNQAFTAKTACQLIGGNDPDHPGTSFKEFEDDLYIEQREIDSKLTAPDVFTYLVDKGLFRIGSELKCPNCRMTSWIALDNLKQRVTCEMCGREFDATRQLIKGEMHYRRTGVLGAERNAQGAVPVALTLQQLEINLGHSYKEHAYSTSLELTPDENSGLPPCEVDFVWLVHGRYPKPAAIILGECKDRGRKRGDGAGTIDAKDVTNFKAIGDALPAKRFEPYFLFAKLAPFTPEEIEIARTVNSRWRRRAILLTARELETWRIYQRTNKELKIDAHGGSAEDLALTTARIYFPDPLPPPATSGPMTNDATPKQTD
jgi:hypothetical protein